MESRMEAYDECIIEYSAKEDYRLFQTDFTVGWLTGRIVVVYNGNYAEHAVAQGPKHWELTS